MRLKSLAEYCSGRRLLFLDKTSLFRRLGLKQESVEFLRTIVVSRDEYLSRFDLVLYCNPEAAVNRAIVANAERLGIPTIYCADGFYEYSNVCFNSKIRKERPYGTFVRSKRVAVRTYGEALFFSLLHKEPLLI